MHKIDTQLQSSTLYVKNKEDDLFYDFFDSSIYDSIIIITNKSIFDYHSNHEIFNQGHEIIFVQDSEDIKNLNFVEKKVEELILNGCTRNSLLIGVGGGSITDFTGFVASIFMRGVPHVFIPTTLLGMVDASLGGKTGINVSHGKNLIGTFKQPSSVFIDASFLETLEKIQIINGFAEIIKYGLICDANLYNLVEENFDELIILNNKKMLNDIITQCCQHKIQIVSKDELDKNHRMILNFGHTVGHALESYFSYQDINHGDAVYYGMIAAGFISSKLNYLSEKEFKRINQFINSIPKFHLKNMNVDELLNCMKYDKKKVNNNQHFILLKKIGESVIAENISKDIIKESLRFII